MEETNEDKPDDPITVVEKNYFNPLSDTFLKWNRKVCVMKMECNE